jgi:molybdenum cofactor cytidylyltransferase
MAEFPTAPDYHLGIVLLAAGSSRRMGQPKLLLAWGKTTILGHLNDLWRRLGAAQLAVVCAPDSPLVPELDRLGIPMAARVLNPLPTAGMFSSIQCAARWNGWQGAITHQVIALGDQPQLSEQSLRRLVAFSQVQPRRICFPTYRGHRHHPIFMPRDAFASLAGSQAKTLREFLDHARPNSEGCEMPDDALALDADRPEDYEDLRRRFDSGA